MQHHTVDPGVLELRGGDDAVRVAHGNGEGDQRGRHVDDFQTSRTWSPCRRWQPTPRSTCASSAPSRLAMRLAPAGPGPSPRRSKYSWKREVGVLMAEEPVATSLASALDHGQVGAGDTGSVRHDERVVSPRPCRSRCWSRRGARAALPTMAMLGRELMSGRRKASARCPRQWWSRTVRTGPFCCRYVQIAHQRGQSFGSSVPSGTLQGATTAVPARARP